MLLEELNIMEPKKMKLIVNHKSTIDLENQHVCHGWHKHMDEVSFS